MKDLKDSPEFKELIGEYIKEYLEKHLNIDIESHGDRSGPMITVSLYLKDKLVKYSTTYV